MATAPNVSIDSLSKDERGLIVSALQLKAASIARAEKAEANPAVAEIRVRERAAVEALVLRFR